MRTRGAGRPVFCKPPVWRTPLGGDLIVCGICYGKKDSPPRFLAALSFFSANLSVAS